MVSVYTTYFFVELYEITAASFTILPMQTVAESNSVLEVCVTMMTTPSSGALATNVDLTLTTISDTGKEIISNQTLLIVNISAISDDDFSGISLPVKFGSGMSDGSMVCANVSLAMDGLIECEENFTVELTLKTTNDCLSLGVNTTTVVTLQDSDGKCVQFVYLFEEFTKSITYQLLHLPSYQCKLLLKAMQCWRFVSL